MIVQECSYTKTYVIVFILETDYLLSVAQDGFERVSFKLALT